MPSATYVPLANLTLSSSAASVTFSSISQAYRDLVLVYASTAAASNASNIRFNGDTSSSYSYVAMMGTGSATYSFTGSGTSFDYGSANGGQNHLAIMDYSAIDKHKSVLYVMDDATSASQRGASRWANTAAVTSIVVIAQSTTFASGSTFALYGIAA